MIKVVALEDYLLDDLVDMVTDRRRDVESGTTVTDQPRDLALADLDATLDALRNADEVTISN